MLRVSLGRPKINIDCKSLAPRFTCLRTSHGSRFHALEVCNVAVCLSQYCHVDWSRVRVSLGQDDCFPTWYCACSVEIQPLALLLETCRLREFCFQHLFCLFGAEIQRCADTSANPTRSESWLLGTSYALSSRASVAHSEVRAQAHLSKSFYNLYFYLLLCPEIHRLASTDANPSRARTRRVVASSASRSRALFQVACVVRRRLLFGPPSIARKTKNDASFPALTNLTCHCVVGAQVG